MKSTITLISMFLAFNVHAAQTFKGSAKANGDITMNCRDFTPPAASAAQADADRQATQFCSTFGAKPVRISEFSAAQSACLTEGKGFSTHTTIYVYAQADYNCDRN